MISNGLGKNVRQRNKLKIDLKKMNGIILHKNDIKLLKKGRVIDYIVDGTRLRLQYSKRY